MRIHEDERNLQRILWRRSVDEQLRTHKLSTVTYGNASAHYLATHLQQLPDDTKYFSIARETLTNHFCVDDVLCRADTIDDALKLEQEITALMGRGYFT